MKNNAMIGADLGDLLNVLDSKTKVCIFTGKDGKILLRADVKVSELLADEDFIDAYKYRTVRGFIVILNSVTILIEEA